MPLCSFIVHHIYAHMERWNSSNSTKKKKKKKKPLNQSIRCISTFFFFFFFTTFGIKNYHFFSIEKNVLFMLASI
uniref:Uncharacterized protein n=1 Tax=Strigamia maritima TaxID=126957 RepID=T1JJ17_STRMM